METNTGRTTYKLMEIPRNRVVKVKDLIYNCHSCKRIFSPLKATLLTTNFYTYYEDVFSRMFFILELDETAVCDCRILDTIMLYDNIDPMQKKFGKEKRNESK
jgi:hypothetical protein